MEERDTADGRRAVLDAGRDALVAPERAPAGAADGMQLTLFTIVGDE